jgi:copper resistance protein D
MSLYLINVIVHVLAALMWLGGMFFFALVGAPVLRTIASDSLRAELFTKLGERFRIVGWIAIAVLLVTGVLNLHFRDVLDWDVLGSGAFWRTSFGAALKWKLGAVAAMLLVQGVHDFHLGPASGRALPGTEEALVLRRRAAMLARVSALFGLIVVIAAVKLVR